MPASPNLWLAAVPGVGMVLVSLAAVLVWRRTSGVGLRWFWIGAGLWTVAVAVKVMAGILLNPAIIGWLKASLPPSAFVVCGSLYVGAFSSHCEIGLTLVAAKLWPRLGRSPDHAIAIGVGAGAFEAFLLGMAVLVGVVIAALSPSQPDGIRQQLAAAQLVPLFWLLGPTERLLALLAHVGCRALVLLGAVRRRWSLVAGGLLVFTGVDAVAGAYHLLPTKPSIWWVELAIVPFSVVSLAVASRCRRMDSTEPTFG